MKNSIDNVDCQTTIKKQKKNYNTKSTTVTNESALHISTPQLNGIVHNSNGKKKVYVNRRREKTKRHKQKFRGNLLDWTQLPPDLLRLVKNKLNYHERIHFRAVCKSWNIIQYSSNNLICDMPLRAIALILMKTATNRFQNFFNFFIFWIRDQTDGTIKALLDHIPIQELYHWGYETHRPNESMFTYFMSMAQRLGNNDAEFYWVSKSIIFRNNVYYDVISNSYKIIEDMSTKGHMLSTLFKNMIDIYFFPKRRTDAVTVLANMINTQPKKSIIGMIFALRRIAAEIYPNTIFGPLEGTPICSSTLPNEDNHYQPEGYPVHPQQIDDYTCLQCKVALLMGCLSAYLTESIDFYHSWY